MVTEKCEGEATVETQEQKRRKLVAQGPRQPAFAPPEDFARALAKSMPEARRRELGLDGEKQARLPGGEVASTEEERNLQITKLQWDSELLSDYFLQVQNAEELATGEKIAEVIEESSTVQQKSASSGSRHVAPQDDTDFEIGDLGEALRASNTPEELAAMRAEFLHKIIRELREV